MLQVSGASGLSAVGVRLTDGAWNGQQLSLFAGASEVKFDSTTEDIHFASGGMTRMQLCSGDCCLLSITLVWLDRASLWMETSRASEDNLVPTSLNPHSLISIPKSVKRGESVDSSASKSSRELDGNGEFHSTLNREPSSSDLIGVTRYAAASCAARLGTVIKPLEPPPAELASTFTV